MACRLPGLLADEALAQLSTGEREGMWRKALTDEDARRSGRRIRRSRRLRTACAALLPRSSREDDVRARSGEIYAIYVHPDHWSSGVGQALLDSALADLIGAGFDNVMLWVLDSNARACRFYELAGWARDEPLQDRAPCCAAGLRCRGARGLLPA